MKKLDELSREELKIVFEKNKLLQEKVFDDMLDNAYFWNSEYLNCWDRKGIDYCIGYDRGTYFECTHNEYFIDGLKKAQKNFCFLPDSYNSTIEYVEKLIDRLENLDYNTNNYDLNYERLENRIDELINDLESKCYKRFMSEYEDCFNDECKFNYFYEFYIDDRMNEDEFYVDEFYTLYQHIEYEKSYK